MNRPNRAHVNFISLFLALAGWSFFIKIFFGSVRHFIAVTAQAILLTLALLGAAVGIFSAFLFLLWSYTQIVNRLYGAQEKE